MPVLVLVFFRVLESARVVERVVVQRVVVQVSVFSCAMAVKVKTALRCRCALGIIYMIFTINCHLPFCICCCNCCVCIVCIGVDYYCML